MAFADNAGFDLAIELPLATLTALATRLVALTRQTGDVDSDDGTTGTYDITPALAGVSFVAPTSFVNFTIDLSGSTLTLTATPITGPIPDQLQQIDLGASTAIVRDRVEIAGLNVVIDFATAPLGGSDVTLTLDEPTVLASPAAMFILALPCLFGEDTCEAARQQLLANIAAAVEAGIREAIAGLQPVVLARPPAGLPVPVTDTAIRTAATGLHLLYTLGGTPGAPDAISRSNLNLGGTPPDTMALIFSNAVILRDFLRPAAGAALALAAGGSFQTGHPFAWSGSVPAVAPTALPLGVAAVEVTSMIGGIDGTNIKLVMTLAAAGTAGTFTLDATARFTLPLTVMVAGGAIVMSVGPVLAPEVTSDIDIAWWVYVGTWSAPGLVPLGPVLHAIDAFGGSLTNGPIMNALSGVVAAQSMTIPMPAGIPVAAVRSVSLAQSDTLTRTVPPPRDPYPAHDVIINFT